MTCVNTTWVVEVSQANPTDIEATVYAKNYILYGDQSRAFRGTFPDSTGTPESNHQKASKLHKTVKVQSRIDELQQIAKEQAETDFKIGVGDLQRTLSNVIKEGLKSKKDALGNSIAIALPAVVAAVSEVNRMNGNHAATKTDHSSKDGSMSPKESTLTHAQALALLQKNDLLEDH